MTKPTLSNTVEFKSFHFQLKAIDEDQGIVEGYLSTFGNVDSQKDRVIKGAFKKTLSEAKSRMSNKGKKYLWPVLWMHDPEKPLGGCIDAYEDEHGLYTKFQLDISRTGDIPNNPLAVMAFSGYKNGYVDEQSMGYEAIQKDFDSGVRNLKEVRVWEESCVVMLFAANDQAQATGVKSMDHLVKAASGKTTWPLADRGTKWDAGEATKDIEAWADGDWSKVAQCYFWVAKNPPETLDDCKLPFVAKVGDEMQAIPQGIIAAVGGHGLAVADIPEGDVPGVQAKIATYYKKMDMTPPWEDEGKRMEKPLQRKDFNTLYQGAMAADCLEDWGDIINTLTQAMMQLFCMGDEPQADMTACLDQFRVAVMDWTDKGVQCGLADYLNDNYGGNTTPYVPYSLRVGDDYGYMARREKPSGKVGATFSAATKNALQQHQDEMKAMIDEHKAGMVDSLTAMQQKVSDLTRIWQEESQGSAYGNNDSNTDDGKSRVSRREPPRAFTPATRQQPLTSTQKKKKSTVGDTAIDDLAALFS